MKYSIQKSAINDDPGDKWRMGQETNELWEDSLEKKTNFLAE